SEVRAAVVPAARTFTAWGAAADSVSGLGEMVDVPVTPVRQQPHQRCSYNGSKISSHAFLLKKHARNCFAEVLTTALFRSFPMPDQATVPAENTRKKCLPVLLRFAGPAENRALLALARRLRKPSHEANRRMEGLNQRGAAFLQCGVSRIDRP